MDSQCATQNKRGWLGETAKEKAHTLTPHWRGGGEVALSNGLDARRHLGLTFRSRRGGGCFSGGGVCFYNGGADD